MALMRDFSQQDWQRTRTNWLAWWEGELHRPMVVIDAQEPGGGSAYSTFEAHLTQYGLTISPDEVLDRIQPALDRIHWMGDSFPRWWPNFGPGILAGCLGSPVVFHNDSTWFDQKPGANIRTLSIDLDEENPWWQRVQALTQAAVERWGYNLCIGMTDLGGNLDILASLVGSNQLLTDAVDHPDAVIAASQQITEIWLGCYKRLAGITQTAQAGYACWAPLFMPEPGYMLQCDFSYMISPRMFKRFALADLEKCCQHLPYAFYHLDGKGEIPHLDHLLSIPGLRGIQWIPGDGAPPPEEWLDLLRRIREGGKRCQVYVTPHGAQKIMRELGGEGFVFSLWMDAGREKRDLTPGEGEAALEMLAREGAGV